MISRTLISWRILHLMVKEGLFPGPVNCSKTSFINTFRLANSALPKEFILTSVGNASCWLLFIVMGLG
jgi:hypothetical protein